MIFKYLHAEQGVWDITTRDTKRRAIAVHDRLTRLEKDIAEKAEKAGPRNGGTDDTKSSGNQVSR